MKAGPPLMSMAGETSAADHSDGRLVLESLSRLQSSDNFVQLVADADSGKVLHVGGPVQDLLGIDLYELKSTPFAVTDLVAIDGGITESDCWRVLEQRGRIVRGVRRIGDGAPLRVSAELVSVGSRRLVAVSVVSVPLLCASATIGNREPLDRDGAMFCDASRWGQTPQLAFRQAIDLAQEGVGITDSAEKFVYMNRAHARMFGYDEPSELLGKSWRVLYEDKVASDMLSASGPALQAHGAWRGEVQARRRDGTFFAQSVSLSVLPGGGVVCSCHDRTDKVILSNRLSHSEALFRQLLNSMPMGVLIRRMDGPFEFVNEDFGRFAGAVPESFVGASDLGEIGRHGLDAIQGHDQALVDTGGLAEFDHALSWNGQDLVLRVTKFPLAIQREQDSHICTIIRDVTEQRRLEGEERAAAQRQNHYMEMQRQFISMVSHEFRTPLTAIQGAHYLLGKKLENADPVLRADLSRLLKLQQDSIATLKELVDQVLLLNRIDHMTTGAAIETIDIGEAIQRVVASFNNAVDAPRVNFTCTGADAVVGSVNDSLLRTALENLISNGLKYSSHDSPVSVTLGAHEDSWQVAVQDRGRGIPAEEQSKLAESFFRASNVGTVPGTGLGLTIVKRVVDFHGARLVFESKEGVGSTFTLVFPARFRPKPLP